MQPSTANVCYIRWHFCSFTCGHYYSKQTFVSLFSIFNVILRLWTSKFVTKAGERKNHQSLNLLHIKTWKKTQQRFLQSSAISNLFFYALFLFRNSRTLTFLYTFISSVKSQSNKLHHRSAQWSLIYPHWPLVWCFKWAVMTMGRFTVKQSVDIAKAFLTRDPNPNTPGALPESDTHTIERLYY